MKLKRFICNFGEFFRIEHEPASKFWWVGFTLSLVILLFIHMAYPWAILDKKGFFFFREHLPLIFLGVIFSFIILMFVIDKHPRMKKEIELEVSIKELKEKINRNLSNRQYLLFLISLFFLPIPPLLAYFGFFKPHLFELFAGELFIILFFGGFSYVLFLLVEYGGFHEYDAKKIAKIGDEIIRRGGRLSDWQRKEYSHAKKMIKTNKKSSFFDSTNRLSS